MKGISRILTTGFMVWVLLSGGAMAYEESEYKILQSNDAYEIRQYKDRLAVQTVQGHSSNSAFRQLFSNISGSNEASSKFNDRSGNANPPKRCGANAILFA